MTIKARWYGGIDKSTKILFIPKTGVVTAAHNDFVTTLILGASDAGGLLGQIAGKENTIFLEDADGKDLPFEIEGVDATRLVMHTRVSDLRKPIQIKSDGVKVNPNVGITGTLAAQSVWPADHLLVTHMNQSGTDPAKDSTVHANHGVHHGDPIVALLDTRCLHHISKGPTSIISSIRYLSI